MIRASFQRSYFSIGCDIRAMGWQFLRKKPRSDDLSGLAFINMERRLLALEQAMELQRAMLDERTRVMADAIATEFRAVGRIMADLAYAMAQLEAKLSAEQQAGKREAAEPQVAERGAVAPPGQELLRPAPSAAPTPPSSSLASRAMATRREATEDPLSPPPPANDPPAAQLREIDPLLLDALAKGRVAFELVSVSSIPPRAGLLSIMRFASPLPDIDSATCDRLAELFPDAALLLDRFMMDAAASMLRRGQVSSALPLLVPVSPVSTRDATFAADFRRRFDGLNHPGGVYPLLSEAGWIARVEAQTAAGDSAAQPSLSYALRASGERRADPAALAGWGIRYLLAPASVLSAPDLHPLAPDIHAADVARLFGRAGIGLIAEDVRDHVTVLGLLRNNVGMGCGAALQVEPSATSKAELAKATDQSLDYRAYLRRAGS